MELPIVRPRRRTNAQKLPVYMAVAASFSGCVIGLLAFVALVQCDAGAHGPTLLPYQISVSPGPWVMTAFFGSMVTGGLDGFFGASRTWACFHG
jgi:hypothetical protein